MKKPEVGAEVFAKHPFTAEMEEGIVLDIRDRTEEYGRGPFYLVRFSEPDKNSEHAVYTGKTFIRRWVRRQDIETIE
jgi:hypothetical protein|tara:strand:- start:548 stop:778 length:231 start_codon:yes stop_codon:yes gene_type:complete